MLYITFFQENDGESNVILQHELRVIVPIKIIPNNLGLSMGEESGRKVSRHTKAKR